MGIKKPFICEIGQGIYAINEMGLATFYLIEGQKRALVIDTGCGLCDIKEVLSKLTDKPYDVVLTHGHFDHSGGMGSFEKIYLQKNDREIALKIDYREIRKFSEMFGKAGGYECFEYNPDDIQPIKVFPEFMDLEDGDEFDLGGRSVKAYHIPGHTLGGFAFGDDLSKIIFSGDCCNQNLLVFDHSVALTLEGIEKFRNISAKYLQNYNGHTGYLGNPDCYSQKMDVADNLIYICKGILDDTLLSTDYEFLGYKMKRASYNGVSISYNADCIR